VKKISIIGFLKKYKLGAIIGGLYGSIGVILLFVGLFGPNMNIYLVIGFPNFATMRLISDILINFTRNEWIPLIINAIAWIFIGAYIQKFVVYIKTYKTKQIK